MKFRIHEGGAPIQIKARFGSAYSQFGRYLVPYNLR